MNEITVITMTWWQLAIFTMAIFFYGAFFSEYIPRAIKRFVDKMEGKNDRNN